MAIPESFHAEIIEKIAELGHEVGYHYEDVDLVVKCQTGNVKRQRSEVGGWYENRGIGVSENTYPTT